MNKVGDGGEMESRNHTHLATYRMGSSSTAAKIRPWETEKSMIRQS